MKQGMMKVQHDTLGFSGVVESTKQVALDPGRDVRRIIVTAKSNVTDTSITAGETFWGAVSALKAGEGTNLPINISRDEAIELIHLMNPGVITGAYQDPLPVTATDSIAVGVFEGPFGFSRMAKPIIEITLRPDLEWATATVFSSSVKITVIYEDEPQAAVAYYHRVKYATGTTHEMDMGPGVCVDALLIGTTSAYLDKIFVAAAAAVIGKDKSVSYVEDGNNAAVNIEDYVPVAANYQWWIEADAAAGNAGRFLVSGINVPKYTGRKMVVSNSTTDTMLAFFRNVL